MSRHRHPANHELVAVVAGTMIAELDDRSLTVEAGQVIHYPSGHPHTEHAVGSVPIELLFAGFTGGDLPTSAAVITDHRRRIRTILRWLLDLAPGQPLADTLLCAGLLEREECLVGRCGPLEAAIRDFLHAHLHEPLSVDDLAAVAGMSRWHFSRCFRAETGSSPARYLERMRVDAALSLLQHSTLPHKAIAAQVGMRDVQQLSRVIRRATGRPPGAWSRAE